MTDINDHLDVHHDREQPLSCEQGSHQDLYSQETENADSATDCLFSTSSKFCLTMALYTFYQNFNVDPRYSGPICDRPRARPVNAAEIITCSWLIQKWLSDLATRLRREISDGGLLGCKTPPHVCQLQSSFLLYEPILLPRHRVDEWCYRPDSKDVESRENNRKSLLRRQ